TDRAANPRRCSTISIRPRLSMCQVRWVATLEYPSEPLRNRARFVGHVGGRARPSESFWRGRELGEGVSKRRLKCCKLRSRGKAERHATAGPQQDLVSAVCAMK